HPLRRDPAFCAGCAVVLPGPCDGAAACALWAVRAVEMTKAAELFNLSGKIALVTGASPGLGQQFARALADNGAAVALVARRADRIKAFAAELEKAGGKGGG